MTEIEINAGQWLSALAFSADGECVWCGGREGVGAWLVKDGQRTATLETKAIQSLTISKDGRHVAAGTWGGDTSVWDAVTPQRVRVLSHRVDDENIDGVDFSPDSTRLVTASWRGRIIVWDIAARKQVLTLDQEGSIRAAKYSPKGDKIATATRNLVRVYSSNDGRLLVEIAVKVTPQYNTGLLWSNDHLLVVSEDMIKRYNAHDGSMVAEWSVPQSNKFSYIILPKHEKFIVYSAQRTVSFWHMSTHTQLGLIQQSHDIRSIAISPDDRLLGICGKQEQIVISSLPRVIDSFPLALLHPTLQEPDLRIDDATLHSWKQDQFTATEELLTTAISVSRGPSHHVLASRALVRARLRCWDAAVIDATKSIKTEPSVLGYISKSVGLVGKGENRKAFRACDIAFERFHSTHTSFLLLVKAIIVSMTGDHEDAISRVDDLIETVHFNSICHVVQAYMYFLFGTSCIEKSDYSSAMKLFQQAQAKAQDHKSPTLSMLSLISGWKFDELDIMIQQRLCEVLFMTGRIREAGGSLLSIVSTVNKNVYTTGVVTSWVPNFLQQCLSTPESTGDMALDSSTPTLLLTEWVKLKLMSDSWQNTLTAAANFVVPRLMVYRAVCDRLETLDKLTAVTECFHQMTSKLAEERDTEGEQARWMVDFRQRIPEKLERLGDAAVNAGKLDEAISIYSSALSLNPRSPSDLLIKRSKAYVMFGSWEDGLKDADNLITHDSSSPWGYERRHAALHAAKRYEEAVAAHETMVSKILESHDPEIRERHREYIDPEEANTAIRVAVESATHNSPSILINTDTGQLFEKAEQTSSFNLQPIFWELISSMTTRIDQVHIEEEVAAYYNYGTFSHKWELNEPLFENVRHVTVRQLDASPTHYKLQMFCKLVHDSGYHWAWSDTCCINKVDLVALQEAMVSMFKWYENSSVTIVLLLGVRSPGRRGDLVKSIWNPRAWTLQEYHASKVVRFYTEDWQPYLGLDIPNHKESPEIISEMEEAARVSAQALMAFRPGLGDIREKLRLASKRQTTRVEDAAYSLLGIFSMSLPVVYGEGDQALGRFLGQLLTSLGDTSILAWTGRSGSFNTCLPSDIAVFNDLPTIHIPPALAQSDMDEITARLRNASLSSTSLMTLYDRLLMLPVPSFSGQRMTLPCLRFKLEPWSLSPTGSEGVFHAVTEVGTMQIKTGEDLSRFDFRYLVHPWIEFLLDQQPVGSVSEMMSREDIDYQFSIGSPLFLGRSNTAPVAPWGNTSGFVARLSRQRPRERATTSRGAAGLLAPPWISQTEKKVRALEVVARLRQPFGALLLAPKVGTVAAFKRVAAGSVITVQMNEFTAPTLNRLVECIGTLDVL